MTDRQRKSFARRAGLLCRAGLTVGCLAVAAGLASGCATQLADAPIIGVPANAPARPATPTAYLPIHDVPPPREEVVPSDDQRARLSKELLAARDRQNAQAEALAKQKAK